MARSAIEIAQDSLSLSPKPFIRLSKLSEPVVCRREHDSEIHESDKRSLAHASLFVGAASEAGKLFSNRLSWLRSPILIVKYCAGEHEGRSKL